MIGPGLVRHRTNTILTKPADVPANPQLWPIDGTNLLACTDYPRGYREADSRYCLAILQVRVSLRDLQCGRALSFRHWTETRPYVISQG